MILHSTDYENTLNDALVQKLNWIEEEFNFQFKSKKTKFSQKDRDLANRIINNITEIVNCSEDIRMKQLLVDTLKSIKNIYPELF